MKFRKTKDKLLKKYNYEINAKVTFKTIFYFVSVHFGVAHI